MVCTLAIALLSGFSPVVPGLVPLPAVRWVALRAVGLFGSVLPGCGPIIISAVVVFPDLRSVLTVVFPSNVLWVPPLRVAPGCPCSWSPLACALLRVPFVLFPAAVPSRLPPSGFWLSCALCGLPGPVGCFFALSALSC